ncbi:MAG: hypothetical protein M0Z42_05890 [Actinomycetota bacterium]|nr:hypothetical protein [Actinomycetota bacterium]
MERRGEPSVADPVDVDVDGLPEGLVVASPDPWAATPVCLLAVRHQPHGQRQVGLDGVPVDGGLEQLLFGVVQLGLDPLSFRLDQVHRDDAGEVPLHEASPLVLEVVDPLGTPLALPLQAGGGALQGAEELVPDLFGEL